MDFELGTVVACDEAGCAVRLVESGETIRAAFSAEVKDRVRIRQQQLVAINPASSPPEIAWRWFRGVVEAIDDDTVSVRRLDLGPDACRVVSNAPGIPVSVGDDVYYGHHDQWTVIDRVLSGGPSQPASIASRYFARMSEQLSS